MIYLATYCFGPYEGDIQLYIEIDSELNETHLSKCVSFIESTLNEEIKNLDSTIEMFKRENLYDESLEYSMEYSKDFVYKKLKALDEIKDRWIQSLGKTSTSTINEYFVLTINKIESVKL